MKKLLLLLYFLPFGLAAQAPVNDLIEAAVLNRNSEFYYPTLFYRYTKGDLTLTRDDYRHLYYGFMFSPSYTPHESLPEMDSILMIFDRTPDPGLDEMARMVRFGEKALEAEPFNIRVLNFLTFAWGGLGNQEKEYEYFHKVRMLVETITGSGLGTTEDSPWHILYFSHAADVMDYLEIPYLRRMVVSRNIEYLPLVKRQGEIRGYYFDFSRIYTVAPDGEKKDKGWEINGMKVK